MRSERPRAGIALCVLAGLLGPRSAGGEVVERILAVAEGRPVLLSEVRLQQELRGVDQEAALEGLIDERFMYREAARLPAAVASAEEEARAVEALRARLGPRAEEFSAEGLRRVARRQATILKYVELRFRSQVRIDEADLRRAYAAQHEGQVSSPSYEEAAPALQRRLEDEQLGQRIEAWVRDLRASALVRYNDLGRGP
jgi:hypothetical protein